MSIDVHFYVWVLVSFLMATGSVRTVPAPAIVKSDVKVEIAKIEIQKSEVKPSEPKPSLSEIQRAIRLQHAHELLGKYYGHSVVKNGEKIKKVNKLIYRFAREHLPAKYRGRYKEIAQTIIDESLKNGFDPVLLVSVISGESSFNPDCKGPVDEIGLMQLRPATGEWIAGKYGLPWAGAKTLHNPVENIRIGAAYLQFLREKFDSHARLYLAAYNMGAGNVDKSREKNIWPKDYPIHVMKRYVEFYSYIDNGGVKRL